MTILSLVEVSLVFAGGSVEIRSSLGKEHPIGLCPSLVWDSRTLCYRAYAFQYREVIEYLRANNLRYIDNARGYQPRALPLKESIEPREHQKVGLGAWLENNGRGVVVLPTGSGKTILAVMAISRINRPTLVHVPTLDLVEQWKTVLQKYFDVPIGVVGGGLQDYQCITVTTYQSAQRIVPFKGAQFGFLIFDECHHLPGESFQAAAQCSLAPFRLGLTATPDEGGSTRREMTDLLVGKVCSQAKIGELSGSTLAPYEVQTVDIELSETEQKEYEIHRSCYIDFVRSNFIDFSRPTGWQDFLRAASRSEQGRKAFRSYRQQKNIALSASAKFDKIWELLVKHGRDQVLIFTQDNATAYHIGELFILPVITHHTHQLDRLAFLQAFRCGKINALVTSKVLNEGVDVPQASVGIIVSGSGTVREHVQRLGRILRASEGKKAVLYELVTSRTGEESLNQRRRNHDAYQGTAPLQDA